MDTKDIKHHFKKFFWYDIPQNQLNIFYTDFIEFCIYITSDNDSANAQRHNQKMIELYKGMAIRALLFGFAFGVIAVGAVVYILVNF